MDAEKLDGINSFLIADEPGEYEKPLFIEQEGLVFTKEILGEFNQNRFCIQCSGCHGCR